MAFIRKAFGFGLLAITFAIIGPAHFAVASTVYSQSNIGTPIELGTSNPLATNYYGYYFSGATLGNSPTNVGYWTSTSVINKMRVKRISGVSCVVIASSALILDSDLNLIGGGGFSFHGTSFGDYCDMTTFADIPVGTKIGEVALVGGNVGASSMVLDGSPLNSGISINGNNDAQTPGGFAFQLCDNLECDQTFEPPTPPACVTDCFSNVLFLPGFKSSVLKNGNDTLWPPTVFSINDTSQLALNTDGTSVNEIYTDGIINNFLGTPIYGPFTDFMDNLSGPNKTINEWLPLSYDWRYSPEENIANGVKTKDGLVDVIARVEELASTSKSGKVTIVAHSMGGLFGKAIIKKLEEQGKDSLIDSFVMVGTPQLGTPQAIAALLHGTGEGVGAGFIVNGIEMRAIGQNISSAYDLLPSSAYFNEVPDPVITFDPKAQFTNSWRNLWGITINNYDEFSDFMTGQGVARTKPAKGDLHIPEVLRSDIFAKSENFHNEYDDYNIPDHVRVVQIAGWGVPTVKAVEYTTNHGYQSYKTIPTIEGDSTVVYSSSLAIQQEEKLFFDLSKYNREMDKNIQHRSLLNNVQIQNVINSILSDQDLTENNYILRTKPVVMDIEDQLIVSSFSPVVLGAYDSFGNFTGVEQDQDLSADILSVKEDIPGSTFLYTGDQQSIFLPKDGVYSFVYKGVGVGPTTLTIDNFSGDIVTPIVSYTDMPTTNTTVANFEVNSASPQSTVVSIDTNNDGNVDTTIRADGMKLSLEELIVALKTKISALDAKDRVKQNLLKKVTELEKKIETKKQKNAKNLEILKSKISKLIVKGKIDSISGADITSAIEFLEMQSDSIVLDPELLIDLTNKVKSLTLKDAIKKDLLKRIETLDKKYKLLRSLNDLSKNINRRYATGKIGDADAQTLTDLINQIISVI